MSVLSAHWRVPRPPHQAREATKKIGRAADGGVGFSSGERMQREQRGARVTAMPDRPESENHVQQGIETRRGEARVRTRRIGVATAAE